eukprot:TRINITY_DN70680_c0_g1_i1.p1 TRINITY_DN70680_c0_g1~~TRINITY_DN70680_c0_g1_i1.p1  ORF type:complete len:351 (+),score=74.68 TRINITY_DN70680_c0_g1_i1:89-1054(+)
MPVYKEHRLDVLCSPQGQKHTVSLGKQPAVFTFNVFNERTFQCHLELQLLSEDFGFYVFIDKLWLDKTPGCGGDFLQFGRDFAFLTSYKSKKYCDRIDPTTKVTLETEDGAQSKIDFGSTSTSAREYVETNEQDMDVWVSIKPPIPGKEHKQLRLVVTPFKKSCSTSDTWWWPCKGSDQCVRRDLLCDGVLNCAGGDSVGDEQADVCVTRVYPAGLYFNLPLVLLSALGVVTGLLFVLCAARLVLVCVKRRQRGQQSEEEDRANERLKSEDREVLGPPSAPPDEEFSDLPPLPPSYIEAVSSDQNYMPPMYSNNYYTDLIK